ncbi:hypothetical protein [Sphingobium sp. EM0848]|uniref:hypothetical protein n=1 Tax=Sphingobium sp. EM0848 TaxID=2743473 RepID=UPI00159CA1A0|nr:hypothetical protein [Sphingobium sp. EM0848]
MVEYELMSPDDYDNLPEEPEEKFIAIERTCRINLNSILRTLDENDSWSYKMIQLQYMTTVSAAAAELNISGVEYPNGHREPHLGFDDFLLQTSGAVTRARLRKATRSRPFTVQLAARTRGAVELQINKLRSIIEKADIPEARRRTLLRKLDELNSALNEPRTSFAQVGVILATLASGVAIGTSFLADAPQAIMTIQRLVGADKDAEEAERSRLGPPPARPALPPPPTSGLPAMSQPGWKLSEDFDDEVPF